MILSWSKEQKAVGQRKHTVFKTRVTNDHFKNWRISLHCIVQMLLGKRNA